MSAKLVPLAKYYYDDQTKEDEMVVYVARKGKKINT
jgi:hypothetical protein